jgi:5-formyltetrahydrofolate cyclo-ligase
LFVFGCSLNLDFDERRKTNNELFFFSIESCASIQCQQEHVILLAVLNSVFVQPLATDSKQTWRRWAKQQRSMSVNQTLEYEVVKTLRGSDFYQNARHVLTYLTFGSEVSLAALHQDSSKTFYITRVREDNTLTIHHLTKNLETHRYGFSQPPITTPLIDVKTIDLVLVPGLCFDRSGTRLGYGKGHYDRLLPGLLHVPRVGVTAESLLVEMLPKDDFDIPMTHVVTEAGLLRTS